MQVKVLQTVGQGYFEEVNWDKPEPTDEQIEVQSVMTGVCRSDIDMMQGNFGPLPLEMQGHEGLGIVTKVGKNVLDVTVGDYVATRGEPAYADYYNVRSGEFVVVPSLEPKYIIEPVACGVNVIEQAMSQLKDKQGPNSRMLILGSGFLAWVAYHTVKFYRLNYDITVVGSNNRDLWGDLLAEQPEGTYDVIIDLSSRPDVFTNVWYNESALIVMAAQKAVTTDFANMLWRAVTMVFPSPRNPNFIWAMQTAVHLIKNGRLDVDKFWTRAYNRDSHWQQAFTDGVERVNNYSRGYIVWD